MCLEVNARASNPSGKVYAMIFSKSSFGRCANAIAMLVGREKCQIATQPKSILVATKIWIPGRDTCYEVTHRLDSPRISTPPSPCCISQFLTPTTDWLEISYRRCQQWAGWFAQVLNYRRCLSQIHQQQTSSQYATFWPVHWDTPQDHRRNCLNSLWRRTEPTPTCQQYSIQLSTSFVQYANANLEFFAKKVIAAACYTHHLRASACWQPFAPYYLRSLALGPGTADDYFVYVVRDTTKQMVKYFVVDEHQRRHLSLAISRTAVDFYAPGIYSSLTSSTTNKPRMRCTGAPFICCSKAWKPGTC